MKNCPNIGDRVQYITECEWERDPRTCSGYVTKIYKSYDWDFDDDDEPILGSQRMRPVTEWKVAVKVDRPLPKWWPYGDQKDVFCPTVNSLRRETAQKRRAA